MIKKLLESKSVRKTIIEEFGEYENEDSAEKAAWGRKAVSLMRQIARGLKAHGFEMENTGRWNKGGSGVFGDVHTLGWKPGTDQGIHIWAAGFDDRIIYRTTDKAHKWSGYANHSISPSEVKADVDSFVSKLVSMVDEESNFKGY